MEKQSNGKSTVIIVTALIVIAAVLGGVVGGFFLLPQLTSAGAAANASAPGTTPGPEGKRSGEALSVEPGMMYPMKERVVNLADPGGLRYLKIELVLELDLPDNKSLKGEAYKKRQDELIKEMTSRRPIIDDIVTTILAGKTWASLSTPEGKERLRDELKSKLGEVTGENKLHSVYFTQFIIQ